MKISELLVPLQNAVLGRGKIAQNHSPRTGKHHGNEGWRRRKKGGAKLPKSTAIGSDSLFMRKWQLRCGHDVIINMHALINMHVIRNMMSHFSGKLGNTSRMTSHTNAWKIKRTWTHISTQHCIHRNVTYLKTTKHHSYGVLGLPWKPLTLGNSWTSKQVVYTHVYIYICGFWK